jgi:hypothetical protein
MLDFAIVVVAAVVLIVIIGVAWTNGRRGI